MHVCVDPVVAGRWHTQLSLVVQRGGWGWWQLLSLATVAWQQFGLFTHRFHGGQQPRPGPKRGFCKHLSECKRSIGLHVVQRHLLRHVCWNSSRWSWVYVVCYVQTVNWSSGCDGNSGLHLFPRRINLIQYLPGWAESTHTSLINHMKQLRLFLGWLGRFRGVNKLPTHVCQASVRARKQTQSGLKEVLDVYMCQ